MAFTSLGVLEGTKERLTRIKLKISAKLGKDCSYSDIIDYLIEKYEDKDNGDGE